MAQSLYFSNGIVRERGNNELRCFLCANEEISQNWQRHIEDPQHVSAFRQFCLIFVVNEETIDCRACNASVEWEGLKNHAKWHRIVPWYEIENKDKIFFENRVLNVNSCFICVPCETRFDEWSGAFVHIGEEQHRKLIALEPPIHETFAPTDSSYEFLIAEGFEPWGSNTVKCRPCLCPNVRLNNLQEHISQPEHVAAKRRFVADSKYHKNSSAVAEIHQRATTNTIKNSGSSVASNNLGTSSASEKLIAELRSGSFTNVDKIQRSRLSHRTNSASRMPNSASRMPNSGNHNRDSNSRNNSHIRRSNSTSRQESNFRPRNSNSRNNNSNSRNANSSLRNEDSIPRAQKHKFPVESRSNGLFCTICEVAVQTTSDIHIAEEEHVRILERLGYKYISPIDDYKFRCECCKCVVPNLENVFRHIRGSKHRQLIPVVKERQVNAPVETMRETKVEAKKESRAETKEGPKAETREEKEKGKVISFKMNFPRPSNSPAINPPPQLPPNQFQQAPLNYPPAMNFPSQPYSNTPLGLNFPPRPLYPPPPLMSFPITIPQQPAYLPLATNCMPRPSMDRTPGEPKFTPENLPRDYIVVQNPNDLFCRICDCVINGHCNVDAHINDQSHSLMVEDFCATMVPRGENDYYCKRCNATVANRNDLYIHFCRHVNKANRDPVGNIQKNSDFLSPNKNTNNSSVENKSSNSNVQDKSPIGENSFSRNRTANDFIVILGRLDFCCKLCHIVLSDQTKIETHLEESEHRLAFRKYEQTKMIKDSKYDCICCKCQIPNFANVPPHVFGEQHKLKSPASSSIRKSSSIELGPDYIVRIGEEDYYCNICNITIVTKNHLDQHLKDEMHSNSRKKYGCEQILSTRGSRKNIQCVCCDCIIPDYDCIYVHLSGRRHLDNVAQKRKDELQQNDNEGIVQKDEEPKQLEKTSGSEMEKRREFGLENACGSIPKSSEKEESAKETGMEKSYHEDFEKHFQKLFGKVKERSPLDLKIESDMIKLAIDDDEPTISGSLASSTMSLNTTGRKLRVPRVAKKPENAVVNPDEIFEMLDKLQELKNDIELCVMTYDVEGDDIEFNCMICMKKMKKSDLYEHFRTCEHCEALESKRRAHKEFELVSEQYSDYHLAKEFLEEESEDLIYCWVCKTKIINLDQVITAHVETSSHAKNRDTVREKNRQLFVNEIEPNISCDWYDIHEFFCTICRIPYSTEFEFAEHAQSSEHVVTMKNINSSYRPLIHDFCSTCSILWFGKRSEYALHVETSQHRSRLEAGSKSNAHRHRATIADCLFDVCRNGIEEMSVDAYLLRRKFTSDLEKTIQQSFPATKVQILGANPVSVESGKFEVALNFGVKLDQKSEDSVRFLTQRVAAALNDHPARWHMALINDKPSPMRVTTHHIPSKSKVEIFFNNKINFGPSKLFNSLRAACTFLEVSTRAIKFCIQLYENEFEEELRPYIEDTIVFFAQSKSLLPKISDLVQFDGHSYFKPDWDIEVNELNLENPWEFLIEYHRFYANFDYRREVVCPWIGESVKKRDLLEPQNISKEKNFRYGMMFQVGEFSTPLSIQDPLGLLENRTKRINKAQLNGFREYCSWVVETLERQRALNSQ